jgi:hypothetical protein
MTYDLGRKPAAILLLTLVLTSCAGESPSPTVSSGDPSPSEPVTQPSSTPEPTATPLPVELTWTDEVFPGNVTALITDGDTLVAVGRDADGLASWTSTDGTDWIRNPVPDPTFITDEQVDLFGPRIFDGTRMGPLTRLGDTLFSFGTFYGFNDFIRPAAYGSPDGATWEFVESNSPFYGFGAVGDAETFDDGLVATLTSGLSGPNNNLWTWEDGQSWQETSVKSRQGGHLIRLDAAASDDQVVVVGQRAENDDFVNPGQNEAVAWVSSDARQWDEINLPEGMASACGVDQTPTGGFAVMGTRHDGGVSVWTTSDLSTWARADLEPGFCGLVAPIALAGDWLVANTATGAEGSKVWLSSDGLEWVQQDIPQVMTVVVAELKGQLHVLGSPPTDDRPFESVLLHGAP